ncbi:MAG TPA: PDZ domain-containing protein [Candidatus Solibacter sp.]
MKNWPNGFGRACATISLLLCPLAAQPSKAPAIALLDAADAVQWQNWTSELGWRVIVPEGAPSPNIDTRVQALVGAVQAAIRNGTVDPARVYIAGRGDAAAAVFYTISRVPDLWAAGAAIGGSPKPALDTNRVFAANFTNVPVMWISSSDAKPLADKLTAAKLNLEWQPVSGGANAAGVIQWLAQHKRDPFPMAIDCETNSPTFANCYWIQMTKFDPAERNDVLESTRVPGGSGAALDLGGFAFKTDEPGPGVLVTALPKDYSGPLKVNDRLVALDGKPIADPRQYADWLDRTTEEKSVTVTVQRGKDRIRVETRVVLPRREGGVSARVEAQYLPADKEIQIVSRTVTEMRITVPPHWLPGTLLWNGLTLENLTVPGCWMLSMQKEILHAEKCK